VPGRIRNYLEQVNDRAMPVVLVFDAQDTTYQDVGDMTRGHLFDDQVLTIAALEQRNPRRPLRYLFAHVRRLPRLELARCEILAYQGRAISQMTGTEAPSYGCWFPRRSFPDLMVSVPAPFRGLFQFGAAQCFPNSVYL
jgi:hypothetical protein